MNGPVATWDNTLRALVYEAHAKRGTDDFAPAVAEIIDAHERWPLIEYHRAAAAAARDLEQREQRRAERRAELVDVLRSTNPDRSARAA